MYIVIFLVIVSWLLGFPPKAEALWFRAQHWCVSGVNNAADGEPANGKIGLLYKEGFRADPANPRSEVAANTLMINAFNLPGGWTMGDAVRLEVPEGLGGYMAGPTPEATAPPFATTGAGFDDLGVMTLQLAVPIVGGPQLNLTSLLQGYYDPAADTTKRCVFEVQAWQGTAPDALTVLSGTATIAADTAGIGHNGFITPGGGLITDGDYYLIIKHRLPGLAAGPNHMPVVTASTVHIPGSFDTTTDEAVVFRKSGTDPMFTHPLFEESNGRFTLKGGFMDGFDPATGIGDIGSADFQLLANPLQWEMDVAAGADQRADLDGDGFVGSADFQMMANPRNWETRTSVPYLP